MTSLHQDSFDVPAIGRQTNSKKDTMPAYSFGNGAREVETKKLFVSEKHEKRKAILNSPGPVYTQPSHVGVAPKYSFGTAEQRDHGKAKYPDSSVDLTGGTVDSQPVKFHNTKGVHFGTEPKMGSKNAEIVRAHPNAYLGEASPGPHGYTPRESEVVQQPPDYSFGPQGGPPSDKQGGPKIVPRLPMPLTSTPGYVGPGSHSVPPGLGSQPNSERSTAPSWSFGSSPRQNLHQDHRQLLDTSAQLSSLGKQVVSNQRSLPQCGFGKSTRDSVAKTTLVTNIADRGPMARLPKQNFHIDLPRPAKLIPKPGM